MSGGNQVSTASRGAGCTTTRHSIYGLVVSRRSRTKDDTGGAIVSIETDPSGRRANDRPEKRVTSLGRRAGLESNYLPSDHSQVASKCLLASMRGDSRVHKTASTGRRLVRFDATGEWTARSDASAVGRTAMALVRANWEQPTAYSGIHSLLREYESSMSQTRVRIPRGNFG